jgi:muramoyltetrapeptide carboxypeptidase
LNGAILFLEDINEEYSKIDRELCALRRSGMMDKLSAIIFGQFTNLQDTGAIPFGFSFEDIVRENTDGLNIPILMNAPFGHGKELLYAFPIGQKALLEGNKVRFRLKLFKNALCTN